MKVLVILNSVMVVALAQPAFLGLGLGGDAPDVAAAKATHLATQAAEAARNTLGIPNIATAAVAAAARNAINNAFNGGLGLGGQGQANIVIGPNGVPLDTPAVSIAKAAHAVARAQTQARQFQAQQFQAQQFQAAAADPVTGALAAGFVGGNPGFNQAFNQGFNQGFNNPNSIAQLLG